MIRWVLGQVGGCGYEKNLGHLSECVAKWIVTFWKGFRNRVEVSPDCCSLAVKRIQQNVSTNIPESIPTRSVLPRPAVGIVRKVRLGSLLVYLSAIALSALISTPSLQAAVYYVSPQGDDEASGISPTAAWRSIEKVNETEFGPGDEILFEGGKIFYGTLKFDDEDSGSVGRPVHVGAYSSDTCGRPKINAGLGRGIDLYNASWFTISDLVIEGSGAKVNRQSGITLLSSRDRGAGNVSIDNVEVFGFGDSGISVGVWRTNAGYQHVRIVRSSLHDNFRAGFFSWGKWGKALYAHRNIYIGDSVASNSKGGSGLIFSSVDGGMIERCITYGNGSEVSGAAGIWAWDSNDIVFQYNESYGNRTIGVDGDGFDFDGGVTNSVMQYNYSHDNDAAGFLLAQYAFAPQPMKNIVIRYNISENDCRKKDYGAIHVWKGHDQDRIEDVKIYQNTVYLADNPTAKVSDEIERTAEASSTRQSSGACAIAVISPTISVSIQNNLFYAAGGRALVSVVAGQQEIRFCNNAYWTASDPFQIDWMGSTYGSLAEWLKAASDQERLGSKILAVCADPMLEAPGTGGTVGKPDRLTALRAYRLKVGSPLRGRGIDLARSFGIDPGGQGFYGSPISQAIPPSIGANVAVDSL